MLAAAGVDLPPGLLRQALTHRSWAYENGGVATNERLEFLGDSVLGLAVTEALYRRYPEASEGTLSRMRIAVVSRAALARVARRLGVGPALLLGRGEEAQGGRDKDSILADTTEALIGAVFLTHGVVRACEVVLAMTGDLLEEASRTESDHKTALQVAAAAAELPPPRYEVTGEGPVHERTFTAHVAIGDSVGASGTGRTKKAAEQAAAQAAMAVLRPGAGSGDAGTA